MSVALPLLAATTTAGFSVQQSYLTMLLSLLLVVGLILLLAWLAKRLQLPLANQGPMKVIATLPLGPKERLLVVQVGEQQLLLASGSNGTRLLQTLEQPLDIKQPAPFSKLLDNYKSKQDS